MYAGGRKKRSPGDIFRDADPLPPSSPNVQVDPSLHIPLRAVCLSILLTFLITLINIGSTAALNAIAGLGITSLLSSYFITIACLVWRRVSPNAEPLPARRWSLGRYGLAINIASLAFLLPIFFFAFWPLSTPVTPETMNWAVVMYVGTGVLSVGYYLVSGRHVYVGPVRIVKRDM